MARARSSFLVFMGLLLASLVPALYLLEWAVDASGRREPRLEGTLSLALDGQQPLNMVVSLAAADTTPGLHLHGSGDLRHQAYPWEATGFEGFFTLELSPDLMAQGPGTYTLDFAASFRVVARVSGSGGPSTACTGQVQVQELSPQRPEATLDTLDALALVVDLRCPTPPSGEAARLWSIQGPLVLTRRPVGS